MSTVCAHCGEVYEEEGRLVCPHCGADADHTHAEDPEEADFAPDEEDEKGPWEGAGCGAAVLLLALGIWALL